MIKTIIFDLGGILIPERGGKIKKEIANYINLSDRKFHSFLKLNHKKLMTGRITLLSLYSKLKKKFNVKIKPPQILKKHLTLYKKYSTKRNKKILDLIRSLKKDFIVVALTNTEKEIAEYNRKKGLFRPFNEAFISIDLHLMKPEKKIYKKILQKLECRPKEAIFIDDKKENIAPARKIGINSILFKNYVQIKKEAKKTIRKQAS